MEKYIKKLKKAFVTNTRLMGVIGLIGYFDTHVDIYHLDFEEYGIDGFDRVLEISNKKKINKSINNIVGGLGGELIEIDRYEYLFLIKEAFDINSDYINLFKELEFYKEKLANMDYEFAYNKKIELSRKMSVDLFNDYELINYFIMRLVGKDLIPLIFLNKVDCNIKNELTKKPQTLLKNTIYHYDNQGEYKCNSLIDQGNGYELIESEIKINNLKIKSFNIINRLLVSPIEASFMLNKKEYILTYFIKDKEELLLYLENNKILLKSDYEKGTLYTEYNKNNEHVLKKEYYLNDDLYGIYYITAKNQLVVSSFYEKNIDKIIKFFDNKSFVFLNDDFVVDKSLIYSFINSHYDNFYDFLNLERSE